LQAVPDDGGEPDVKSIVPSSSSGSLNFCGVPHGGRSGEASLASPSTTGRRTRLSRRTA